MRIRVCVAAVAVVSSGCARKEAPVAVVAAPPPPVVATVPVPKPVPPAGAAANIALPAQLADGTFDTPNRALGEATTVWHLRAALNVAALRCNDQALVDAYNGFVRANAKVLAKAHDGAMRDAGGQAAFDGRMTKLYNYFALPPVQDAFCAAATTIATEASTTPASEVQRLATLGLAALDAPFINFFTRYAAYRADLAAWQAGQTAPRLAYDMSVMSADPVAWRAGIAVASR
ncbi:hypothetical protein [uncultured Sphingomonas sp.]|uniref:hypothetical protein n=1 Tax=uncultured Sphingomonas sp. TaxID=158754 RepID=UPI0025EAA875|nr:hypothetical protein [uncultured Sphingomonas sp.]